LPALTKPVAVSRAPNNVGYHPGCAVRENQPLPEVSLANISVLVVDDEVDSRNSVKKLLELAGATVTVASSASEAFERIQAGSKNIWRRP
jgi:hypoxanthine phosphoribosyltransferase